MPLKDIQLANISPANRAQGLFTVSAYSDDGHKYVTFDVTGERNAVQLRNAIREHADRLAYVFDNTREARAKAVPAPSLMRHLAKLDLIGFGSGTRGDDETDGIAAIDELVSQRAQAHVMLDQLGYTAWFGAGIEASKELAGKWWFRHVRADGVIETGREFNTETEAYHDALMHALTRLMLKTATPVEHHNPEA